MLEFKVYRILDRQQQHAFIIDLREAGQSGICQAVGAVDCLVQSLVELIHTLQQNLVMKHDWDYRQWHMILLRKEYGMTLLKVEAKFSDHKKIVWIYVSLHHHILILKNTVMNLHKVI